MTEWDASTISAVAALVVAVVALLIAIAQAVQQYFITGQQIRLCDSVVYGPMPGTGHRVWQMSQFRFRVLYSIPQISLDARLWPGTAGMVKSYAVGLHRLPDLSPDTSDTGFKFLNIISTWIRSRRRDDDHLIAYNKDEKPGKILPLLRRAVDASQRFAASFIARFHRKRAPAMDSSSSVQNASSSSSEIPRRRRFYRHAKSYFRRRAPSQSRVGEASWVSFCRAIEGPCGDSVRVDLVEHDADRCPSDLVCAPMQTSMRDVVIMALTAGMELTAASFENQFVAMQGAVGTLTTSKHPVLGPILHFTPRHIDATIPDAFGWRWVRQCAQVDHRWMIRTMDLCSVAGLFYNGKDRRKARRLDEYFLHGQPTGGDGQHERSRHTNGHPTTAMDVFSDTTFGDNQFKSKGKEVVAVGKTVVGSESEAARGKVSTANPAVAAPSLQQKSNAAAPGNPILHRRRQDGDWTLVPHHSLVAERRKRSVAVIKDHQTSAPAVQEEGPKAGAASTNTNKEATDENPSSASTTSKPLASRPTSSEGSRSKEQQLPGSSSSIQPERPARIKSYTVSVASEASLPPLMTRQAMVENVPEDVPPKPPGRVASDLPEGVVLMPVDGDEMPGLSTGPSEDRIKTAKAAQAARSKRLHEIKKDQALIHDSVQRGALPSPSEDGNTNPFGTAPSLQLLTDSPHDPEKGEGQSDAASGGANSNNQSNKGDDDQSGPKPGPSAAEAEAWRREKERNDQRRQRDEARTERTMERNNSIGLIYVDFYWFSQMDIVPGYWATPWQAGSMPMPAALTGAVTVVLEAVMGFLVPNESLLYSDTWRETNESFAETFMWTMQTPGACTYPAYALNAVGGIIPSGKYIVVSIPQFFHAVPALELLHSYDWQVESGGARNSDNHSVHEENTELMRLDGWLSFIGRTEEISNGPSRLYKQCPSLVQILMEEFEVDFGNIDLSANEGGEQDIQGLAANVMDFLMDRELTEAEQLYVLVALLRAVKVAQCITAGSDTSSVREIFHNDVQVHLV